jgi:hypothetical protein
MIKEKPGLSSELGHVKRILHQQEDIHIIGDGLAVTNDPKTTHRARWPGAHATL